MGDRITQLDKHERRKATRFFMANNVGRGLLGFTLEDEKGCCFATSWVWFVLPLFPLNRYYLKRTKRKEAFNPVVDTERFYIYGIGVPRAAEVFRTYFYCWIGIPAVLIGPVLLWLVHADEISNDHGFGILLAGFFVFLLVPIIVACVLVLGLRKHVFTPREPQWIGEPDPRWTALAERPISGN